MSILAVTGLGGAPGATTLALALAVAIPGAVLVEADPDGGVLAARLGLAVRPGLTALATAARNGLEPAALGAFAQRAAGAAVVVADPAPGPVAAVLAGAAGRLADALADGPLTAVVDVGRLRPDGPTAPLLARARTVVAVAHAGVEHAARLRAHRPGPGWHLVTTGQAAYRPTEVAEAAGWDLLAHLPDDARAVGALWAGREPGRRSSWLRLVAEVANELTGTVARMA